MGIKKIHIGTIIKHERIRLGLNQAELGKKINRTRSAVSHMEQREMVNIELLVDVGKALQLDLVNYFLPHTDGRLKNKDVEIEALKKESDDWMKRSFAKDETIKEWQHKYENLFGKYAVLCKIQGIDAEG